MKRDLDVELASAPSPLGDAPATRAPAVNRAAAILRLLGDAKSPMRLTSIAQAAGIVPSSCYHILNALVDEGLVVLDEQKRYQIGLGIVSIAKDMISIGTPIHFVQHEVDLLAKSFDVTCVCTQLNEDQSVVVAVAHGPGLFGVRLEVGRRSTGFSGAAGRCNAAHSQLSVVNLRRKFDEISWADPPDFDTWLAEIEEVRRTGVAADIGQRVRGYSIYASPIFENGRVARALAAIFSTGQLTASVEADLMAQLREAALRLST